MQQCNSCHKQFTHSAKLTKTIPCVDDQTKSKAACEELNVFDTIELSVCPYCQSVNIGEALTEDEKYRLEDVIDFKDIPSTDDVSKYLADGWKIRSEWQKNLHIVKYKAKEQSASSQPQTEEGDYIDDLVKAQAQKVKGA